MHCEEFLIDDGTDGQFIKEFHDELIDIFTIFGKTYVRGRLHSSRKLKLVVMHLD